MFMTFFGLRWTVHRAGDLWQADVTNGIYLPDPKIPGSFWPGKLVVIMDAYSRFCVAARFYEKQYEFPLDDCFLCGVSRYGVPLNIHVDYANVFVSEHFREMSARLSVHLIEPPVNHPKEKGETEKFIRRCKDAFYPEVQSLVCRGKLKTLAELNEYLGAWVEQRYNQSLRRDEHPANAYGR